MSEVPSGAPGPTAELPGAGTPEASAGEIHRLAAQPTIMHQGATNACGPYSLAMAASCFWPGRYGPDVLAERLRLFRVPGVGATIWWGLVLVGRSLGLDVRDHWLGQIADLKACVDANHPAIVLVHPDDFDGTPAYTLHYRVVVGYRDDPALPGGGELYFACSGSWADALGDGRPGNVALSYARFQGQWHTYLTVRWWTEVSLPG